MIVAFHKHDYPLQEGHFRATQRPSIHVRLKNQGLTGEQRTSLAAITTTNATLYRAYLLN